MKLEASVNQAYTKALEESAAPWIAFGLDSSLPLRSDRLTGMASLIDWRLHGQVSARIAGDSLQPNELCLFPVHKGVQNFLLLNYGPSSDAKSFLGALTKLGIKALTLAETTFPKDFLSKLKQTLDKGGISTSRLEPGV